MTAPNCTCFICQKPIYKRPSAQTDHNVCSYACRNKYYSGEKSFVWKGGERDKVRDRELDKKRKNKYKEQAVQYLGGKCSICGYNKCNASLDFHHKDPTTKTKDLKNLTTSNSWSKIVLELDKCILLCANCHRELHWNENNKIIDNE
jgi:hypothetical protein